MGQEELRKWAFWLPVLIGVLVGMGFGIEQTQVLCVEKGEVCHHDVITVGDDGATLNFSNPTEYTSSNGKGKAEGSQAFAPHTRIRLSINGCWSVMEGEVLAEASFYVQLASVAIYAMLGLLVGGALGLIIAGAIKLIAWALK